MSYLTRKPIIRKSKKTGGRISKVCKVCRNSFMVYPYRAAIAKVCSNRCSGIARESKIERICRHCQTVFKTPSSQFKHYKGAGKYCSRACSYAGTRAANVGKPITDKYGRSNRASDTEWKQAIRERDDYTCQRCGIREPYIHTHHVAPRSRRPDLRHEISNGKCLCNSCHAWVHNNPIQATEIGLLSDASYERACKEISDAA
jgi:hypothetical protein